MHNDLYTATNGNSAPEISSASLFVMIATVIHCQEAVVRDGDAVRVLAEGLDGEAIAVELVTVV